MKRAGQRSSVMHEHPVAVLARALHPRLGRDSPASVVTGHDMQEVRDLACSNGLVLVSNGYHFGVPDDPWQTVPCPPIALSIESRHPTKWTWSELPVPPPDSRPPRSVCTGSSTVVVGDKFLTVGGHLEDSTYSGTVVYGTSRIFDPSSRRWVTDGVPPTLELSGHSAAALEQTVLTIGRNHSGEKVLMLSPEWDKWVDGPFNLANLRLREHKLQAARGAFWSLSHEEEEDSQEFRSVVRVERWDPREGFEWKVVSTPSRPGRYRPPFRTAAAVAAIDSSLYMVGGQCEDDEVDSGSNDASNAVSCLELVTGLWRECSPMKVPRCWHAVTSAQGILESPCLVVSGGTDKEKMDSTNGSAQHDSSEVYYPTTDQWVAGPRLPYPVCNHSSCSL